MFRRCGQYEGMAGLDEAGFSIKTFDEIRGELEIEARRAYGDEGGALNLESTSLLGQLIGIMAARERALWELALEVYKSQFPALSSGRSLDGIVDVGGLERQSGAYSSGVLYVTGRAGTTIPAGTAFSSDDGIQCESQEAANLAAGEVGVFRVTREQGNTAASFQLSVSGEAYSQYSEIVGNQATALWADSAAEAQTKLNALFGSLQLQIGSVVKSGAAGQESFEVRLSEAAFIPPIRAFGADYVIASEGRPDGAAVGAQTLSFGPLRVPAGSIVNIVSGISGASGVVQLSDFILGRLPEADVSLRRRWRRRASSGESATLASIEAAIFAVDGVQQVGLTESEGSITARVFGGDELEIAEAIFREKPAGIETRGPLEVYVQSGGRPNLIRMERPTFQRVNVSVSYSAGGAFPAGGEGQMRALISQYIGSFPIGGTLRASPNLIWALSDVGGIESLSILLGVDGDTPQLSEVQLDENQAAVAGEITIQEALREATA